MPRPNRKPSKRKVKVSAQARVRKKNEIHAVQGDTLPRMQARPPADAGMTFKVKIRKK